MIFVDADACPVKAEIETVATRHGVRVAMVSNGGIRPSPNPLMLAWLCLLLPAKIGLAFVINLKRMGNPVRFMARRKATRRTN